MQRRGNRKFQAPIRIITDLITDWHQSRKKLKEQRQKKKKKGIHEFGDSFIQ